MPVNSLLKKGHLLRCALRSLVRRIPNIRLRGRLRAPCICRLFEQTAPTGVFQHLVKPTSAELTHRIKAEALRLGFQAAGVAPASALSRRREALERWIQTGRAGGLAYMERFFERQEQVLADFLDLRSILVLAIPYSSGKGVSPLGHVPSGRVARYAWGRDYHKVIRKRLRKLEAFIKGTVPEGESLRILYSIDTGPVQERVLAEAAGLGFFGKNSCLIRPKGGSYFFLSALLTNLDMTPDQPIRWDCGACTLCLEACPTGALKEPYRLDAGRCIATLTIERKVTATPGDSRLSSVAADLRPLMQDWIFGCDICQEVCPYNQKLEVRNQKLEGKPWSEFQVEAGAGFHLPLHEVLSIRTDEEFLKRFAGTPLTRPKRAGLLRNAAVAAGNSKDPSLIPVLEETAKEDPSAVVREHAAWAVQRIRSHVNPFRLTS